MSDKIASGTYGFITFFYNKPTPREAVVEHVFADGKLLVHYFGNAQFRAIVTPDNFTPSRDAYFCEGSWAEPQWDGDSARCIWDSPENERTDAEAARFAKQMRYATLTNPETTKKQVKALEFVEGDGIPENLDGNWVDIQEVIGVIVRRQKQLGIRRVWVENGMLALAITPDKATFDTGATLQSWCNEAGTAIHFKGAAQPAYDAEGNVLVYLRRD